MEAEKRGGDGGNTAGTLIPGLPDELVVAHVVTRLPWHVRPVCRAFSKSWTSWIDTSTKRPELRLKSRKHQLPLLANRFLICTFDTRIFISKDGLPHEELRAGYYNVQWRDETYQIHNQWRKLPPLQGLLPSSPTWATLIASSGTVFVWSNEELDSFILKLDMGCGDWTWNKFHVSHPFNKHAIHFKGKIYVPRVGLGESTNQEKETLLVYDTMTDQCQQVEAWNHDNLRVLRKKSSHESAHGAEELYSFVEHQSFSDPKLEILVYDACRDSWRTRDKIPIPECQWSELPQVHLVNGDCFEPVPDAGINTVWLDPEGEVISWFNSSLHETWVAFDFNTFLEDKCLEYIQIIHGSLFAIFCENKVGEDDEAEENKHGQEEEALRDQQDPALFKRTLMKGTMLVSSNVVNWEEILDVGCFLESYCIDFGRVTPMDHYTLMV